jgi:hypothetical protein
MQKKYAETVVVIGERAMWDMTMTQTLMDNGRKVHIETSGAYPPWGHGTDLSVSKEKIATHSNGV